MATDRLREMIAALHGAIAAAPIDAVEDAISAASDDLATGERAEDLAMESILDGLRWGLRAASVVERGGGAILRIRAPGGESITYEWDDADAADPQIKAALAAVVAERTIAENVGADDE